MRFIRHAFTRAGAVVLVLASLHSASQAQIDILVQPRGVVIPGLLAGDPPTQARDPIATGIDANFYLNANPASEPFDNGQPAGVIRTTEQTEYYVRFYAPNDPLNPSQPNGPWIMRASTVRGLTPEQIRDRFALPALPTNVTNVLVPAGTCLMSGIAGPIPIWGNGGAQQTFLIAHNNTDSCRFDFLVLGINYINQREIGANALWYAPVVKTGNPASVGAYLDHLPAPTEYSDLYDVYNILDVLNDGTPTTLRPALRELTGESHAAATAIAIGNAEHFARLLAGRAAGAIDDAPGSIVPSAVMTYAAASGIDRSTTSQSRWWAAGGGRFGRLRGDEDQAGYRFNSGQGVFGYDYRPASNWLAGAVLATEITDFSTDGPSNSGTLTSLRTGAYAAAEIGRNRVAASLLASWDHYSTSRSLPTFSRSASASYDGYTVAMSADASHKVPLGFAVIEPLAGLTFAQLWRPAFSENGANAVSLQADSENATRLVSRLGATLTMPIALEGGKLLRPWLRAFWAHDFLDTQGELIASFAGATAPGTFTINTADPDRNTALVGAGLKLEINPTASVVIAYDGEWSRNADVHSISASGTMRW